MKKFNFSKKHKNNNLVLNNKEHSKNEIRNKNSRKEKLKTRVSNIEIKPKFLVIGLVAIITLISLIYFIFLKYSPVMNFKYEGYGISGKEITENLLGASSSSENSQDSNLVEGKNVNLAKIEEQGTIFKKLNSYFIGNKEKTEIDLSYPIYINDKNTIYNLNQDMLLISKSFEQVAGYPNISITDGKVYNGNSLERADSKEYIFAKTEEGIYINLKEIKIETTANEYILPVNSLVVLEENVIRYYSVNNNILVFNEIKDVDYNSQIIIKNINKVDQNAQKVDNEYSYEELLTRLGIIRNDVEKEEIQKEDLTNDNGQKEENSITQENETASNDQENQEQEQGQQQAEEQINAKYIKPEVTVEDFKAEVYTAKSNLHIKDPAGRIIEAPTFEIYKNGKIYLRRTYTNSGNIIVAGLEPKTEYEIIGKYIYKNEENKKIENTFYQGKITTKGYEALGVIELSKENGEIYNNKIQIKNVKITSSLQEEALKGINKVVIVANGIKTTLKNDKANMLLQGKEITVETSEGLPSKSKIDYEIKFFDKNEVELKVENNKGTTRTSKQEPTARITVKEQDIVSVTLDLKLNNKDSVDLENYKYIVTRANGTIAKEEKLAKNEKKIYLNDLDSNQYYEIKIYADYNLDDEKGNRKNNEIGKLVFATKPLSTLGSVEMQVEAKNISTTKVKLTYKIDEERTDKRLIQILNEIKIEIVEKDGEVAKTDTLIGEEIEKLQQGEAKEINYETLKSNTKYEIRITSKVKQGNKPEEIPVTYNYKEFTTLRSTAKVEMQNKFVTGEMIDFDVRIEDKDNAILNNKIRMELRDEKGNLIELTEVETNKEYIRKTYNKLEENKTYTLKFYADQYNEGSTDETYKVNYLIYELEIVTEPGISGIIGLKSMLRKTTGKNLVDVESKVKWYSKIVGESKTYGKIYNRETNILKLEAPSNTNVARAYCYNLKEYIGEEITISFKVKADEGVRRIGINNSVNEGANVTDIKNWNTEEYINYEQTLIVNNTGYVGIYILRDSINYDKKIYVDIQDLQIELGNKKTEYEKYKYVMQGNVIFNLEDKRNEIVSNEYYIKLYEDEREIENTKYNDIPEENKIINGIKNIKIQENENYKIELIIKIRERDYILSTAEFNTKEGEIIGISNVEEYKMIQPEGNYIILEDLDFRNEKSNNQVKVGGDFQGHINFNGHTVYRKIFGGGNAELFNNIGEDGNIENMLLKTYATNDLYSSGGNIFYKNYGNISNIIVNIEEAIASNVFRNYYFIGKVNYGTINGFIVNIKETLFTEYSASCIENNLGIIENGYIYGKEIKLANITKQNSILAIGNRGDIRNVYSLVIMNSEEPNEEKRITLLVKDNISGFVENVYTVGIGNSYCIKNNANVFDDNGGRVKNSYYINDKTFKDTTDKKITNKLLWDEDFQNKVLNSNNMFIIKELIQLGYYPQLKLNECMPRQDYIDLPKITDADLPDILSTEILEQENKRATVKINIYNPAGETIEKIEVKYLTTKIVSQNYKDGKSEVIVELTNPIQCISRYSIISLTTKGVHNVEYTKKYEQGEQNIDINFYNEIYTIDDWYQMKKNAKQNYKLMNDLDFVNANPSRYIGIELQSELEGNGYTIKNFYTKYPLFTNLNRNTKIENLNIKNFNIDSSENDLDVGICGWGSLYSMKNINIEGYTAKTDNNANKRVGSIIANSLRGKLENITISDVKITANNKQYLKLGGVIGEGSADINNLVLENLLIDCKDNIESYVGGIIGMGNNGNNNCVQKNIIVNGKIISQSDYVGGAFGHAYANLEKSLINVNIIADGDFVGGIAGLSKVGSTNYNCNLYKGNIINKKDTKYIGYILGNEEIETSNFIAENCSINGIKNSNIKKLSFNQLEMEETYLKILKWDDNYSYKDLNNKLPKLKNIEKTELLPNQVDILLKEENVSLKEVNTLKTDSNTLNIRLSINNPDYLEISQIEIENMELKIVENRTQSGVTYINLIAKPTKYYSSYQITNIKYLENSAEKNQPIYYLIQEEFFKEINKYEDWQNIEKNSYENYRLLTDLDFMGKTNINSNLKIGKLDTEGSKHKIKNVNIDFKEKNSYLGLIKECKYGIENIIFENITLTFPDNVNMLGVIAKNSDVINNVEFKNIILVGKGNIMGAIAYNTGKKVESINLENINIENGKGEIGGLFGQTLSGDAKNIIANNINIKASGDNVGGIIGKSITDEIIIFENAKISNSNIEGNINIGGLIGSGIITKNSYINNCNIKGNQNIGGAVGYEGFFVIENLKVEYSTIEGNRTVGGLFGSNNGTIENSTVIDSNIRGVSTEGAEIGGIAGISSQGINKCNILNCNITSVGKDVGGLIGLGMGSSRCYVLNSNVEGYSNVGGISGHAVIGNMNNSYSNANVIATEHTAGGILGYLENGSNNNLATSQIYNTYYAEGTIKSKTNVGGIIGKIETELYDTAIADYYRTMYIEANLISKDKSTISLGIGSNPEENGKIKDTYYYKYSNINEENPNRENENYIKETNYLKEEDLKDQMTYTKKLKWGSSFDYASLKEGRYPLIKNGNVILPNQEGIRLPKDEENILKNVEDNLNGINLEDRQENLEQIFEYQNKKIKTYNTYSEIESEDGSKVIRGDIRLYIKDGTLYALPVMIDVDRKKINLVENNFIIDSYNGKEYETVLGEDEKLYDLKEPIEYPENFVNNGIKSIGNNLEYTRTNNESSNKKENLYQVEVIYKNGNKVKFNYQTGEIISSTEENSNKISLFNYMKEKISELGNLNSGELQEITNKYKESKILQNKIEEMPVEDALKEQSNNTNKIEDIKNGENDKANNSLKETRYISIYNAEKDDYHIYQEEELLDTSKQEVVSENEKIEANNLKEYYASEGESKNKNMGILWITLSIIGVVIILFAIRKRD